jgi:lactate dehydrogenase-like 2-hydroxyacid dehydrogenase
MAWALLFSASRRIVEGDGFTRSKKFKGWGPMLMLGQDISKKTLGIIGAGRIGTAFALKSKGFKMKILYNSKENNLILENEFDAKMVGLDDLLQKSDFISIHVPLTNETFHLIGENEFSIMKKNAVLINTSRGPVINEKSLVKALKKGLIFAAGLDVYENEPLIDDELIKLDNVVLQPHSASATLDSRTNMAIMAADNLIEGLKGDIPTNCVNKEVFS